MLAISQKINIFTNLYVLLAIVMQILKQFGFLFQIQTCDSYLPCCRMFITEYAFGQSLALPFCKKKFFFNTFVLFKLCIIYTYKNIFYILFIL